MEVTALPRLGAVTVGNVIAVGVVIGIAKFEIAMFYPYSKILSSTARFLHINSSGVRIELLVTNTPVPPGPGVALEYNFVMLAE
jgi:hypothetical protein